MAIGTGVSYGLYSSAVLMLAVRALGGHWQTAASLFARMVLPFAYALVLLLGLQRWQPVPSPDLWPDMLLSALRIVVSFGLYAVVPFTLRGHPAFAQLWSHFPGARRPARVAP